MPVAIRRLISELGLRFRPSNQADLEAHAAMLALLASDLADIPAHLLDAAIKDWVRESHFMPKASDLIDRAKSHLMATSPQVKKADLGQMNARLKVDNPMAYDGGVRWFREGETLRLGHPPGEGTRCTAADARRILREGGVTTPFLLEILGAIERGDKLSA